MSISADPEQPHRDESIATVSHTAAQVEPACDSQSLPRCKAALRADMRARRAALSEEQRAEANAQIAAQAERLIQATGARRAAAYLPTLREPGGTALVDSLYARLDALFLPICRPDGQLNWAAFDGWENLTHGPHGIQEPLGSRHPSSIVASCDLLFVPALAVTPQGFRLGQGGGYYDRTLARLTPGAPLRVAVVFDDNVVPSIPIEDHDAPVEAILTPSMVLSAE